MSNAYGESLTKTVAFPGWLWVSEIKHAGSLSRQTNGGKWALTPFDGKVA